MTNKRSVYQSLKEAARHDIKLHFHTLSTHTMHSKEPQLTAMDLNESEVNTYSNYCLTSVFAYPLWKMCHMHVNVNISFLQRT